MHEPNRCKIARNRCIPDYFNQIEAILTNLRDTLLVHFSVEHCPCYSARVLALQEKGFGFAILETKDLAVTSNVELALDFQDAVSWWP